MSARRACATLGGVFIALIAICCPGARAAARGGSERVVVLEPAGASTDTHRCLTRIREELVAGGFEVEVIDPGPQSDPVSIAGAMEEQAEATAVAALIGDPSSGAAELWILDRVAARPEVHRIVLSEQDSEHLPEIAAIKTIEVLRASALKQLVESSRVPVAGYRDGTIVSQANMPSPILAGDTTLYFGTWNMLTRFLAATIDDFAVWNRALSPAEAALLSMQPPGG
jgi:hypothetical protein